MGRRKSRSSRAGRTGDQARRASGPQRAPAQPAIPESPPMADGRGRTAFIIALVLFGLWLVFLAFLAVHTGQWAPGP